MIVFSFQKYPLSTINHVVGGFYFLFGKRGGDVEMAMPFVYKAFGNEIEFLESFSMQFVYRKIVAKGRKSNQKQPHNNPICLFGLFAQTPLRDNLNDLRRILTHPDTNFIKKTEMEKVYKVTFRATGQLNGPVPITRTVEYDETAGRAFTGHKRDEAALAALITIYITLSYGSGVLPLV